jgi:putative transposase
VSQWKKEAAERLPEVFARKGSRDHDAEVTREREKELFEEIGRLKMELEWLKKKVLRRFLWVVEGGGENAV